MVAQQRAAATGEPVEVVEARDEYSQTFANPDGSFTLAESVAPQRARAADGSWVAPDSTLVRRADGSIGPRAAVTDLSFSTGGDGAGMIRLARAGQGVTLDWPGRLPAPKLSADTATYPDVLPGVDLLLTASVEGYQQVLVVKTAKAATNPALTQVKVAIHGTQLRVVPDAGGGLRALDGAGNAVFSGPAGLMWDSTGDATGGDTTPPDGNGTPVVDSEDGGHSDPADAPSAGDSSSELPIQVSGSEIAVIPDVELLQDATYPVYIDPPVGLSASKRTVVTSSGNHYWQFDNDYDSVNKRNRGRGVGRCSSQVINGVGIKCASPAFTSRMFFSFSRAKLAGKIVQDATFRLTETWSFTCTASWVNLYRTSGDISESTRWPGPSTVDKLGDRQVSHGRGSACSPAQPAAVVEFNDNPDETDENLTSTVSNLAKGTWSTLTLMLRANDESEANSWKKFNNDATLQVTYFPAPGVPSGVGVLATNDPKSLTCRDSTHAITVADPTPDVRATVQTSVQPASGESKGSLRAGFVLQAYDAAKKTWSQVWKKDTPSSGYAVDGTQESAITGTLADSTSYRLQAQTVSHGSYAGVNQDPRSGFSSWCYFTVNSKAPKAPQIMPAVNGPYSECTADVCASGGGPGVRGSFTFQPDPGDKDITGYRWSLTGPGKPHDVTGATVTVPDVTPALSGTMVLTVEAMDLPGRYGPPRLFQFKVGTPVGPVGRWQFTEASGATAADDAEEGIRHSLAVNTGATFDGRGRRGDTPGDHALALDGKTGFAASTDPVVNTAASFSVSAWAYLTDTSRSQSLAAQGDGSGTGFNLAYQPATGWVFDWHKAPAGQTAAVVRSSSVNKTTPAKVWTHVAGVYDAGAKTIQVFVNGRPQGSPVAVPAVLTPVLTVGGLQVGRGGDTAAYGDYAAGMLDEVQVWGRALTADEFALQARSAGADGLPATALAGSWSAGQGSGTAVPDMSGYGRPALALAPGSSLSDDDMLVLDGVAGYATAAGPVVDETGSFTVTARVEVNAAELAKKPAGYVATVAGQQVAGEASWGLWYQLDSVVGGVPQGRWYFGRTALDGSSQVKASGSAHSVDVVDLSDDPVVQLTGVYDAQDDSLHLYIGEQEQVPDDDLPATFPYAQQGAGELSVGRGRSGGAWGRYLPGQIGELRIWTGAMTRNQIVGQILDLCSADCVAE